MEENSYFELSNAVDKLSEIIGNIGMSASDAIKLFNSYSFMGGNEFSWAEGSDNIASGEYSHTEGMENITLGPGTLIITPVDVDEFTVEEERWDWLDDIDE